MNSSVCWNSIPSCVMTVSWLMKILITMIIGIDYQESEKVNFAHFWDNKQNELKRLHSYRTSWYTWLHTVWSFRWALSVPAIWYRQTLVRLEAFHASLAPRCHLLSLRTQIKKKLNHQNLNSNRVKAKRHPSGKSYLRAKCGRWLM